MKKSFVVGFGAAFLLGVLSFQNCSQPKFDGTPSDPSAKFRAENNGYGYNGKLQFIKVAASGACPDENRVEIQIAVRINQEPFPDAAFVERENCTGILPKVLKVGEEAVLSADLQSLTYKTETLTVVLVRDPNAAHPVLAAGPHLYVSPNGSDANPGTQDRPFLTIQKAADTASPGTTVHVAPGEYVDTIDMITSGTENARIRFVSDEKWGARIRPVGETRGVWRSSGDYVDIIGFEIDGSTSPDIHFGLTFFGSHSSVQNNRVHHIAITTPCDATGASGIYAAGGSDSKIDEHIIGNTVHDIGNLPCASHRAIMHASTGSLINNVVYKSTNAIQTWHNVHHVLIANNTLFSIGGGIMVGSGDYVQAPAPADYMTVINNIVAYSSTTAYGEVGPVGPHNVFANNLTFGNFKDWALSTGRVHTGSIAADPLFINYLPDGTGDYRLQAGSPAVDSGVSADAPGFDIEGNSRRATRPDLGAFEWRP